MDPRLQTLIDWIRTEAARANGLLVPISGGSDGAFTFWLCCQAYPEKTAAVFAGDNLRCREWFENTGKVITLPAPTDEDKDTARWLSFMALCRKERRWLVGTRNHSEEVFGTFSMASRLATFMPIINVWKGDVMELCKLAGVPTEITDSSRRADPDCGRPKEMAEISLEGIDRFLKVKMGQLEATQLALTDAEVAYLEQAFKANSFRRHLPTRGPKV